MRSAEAAAARSTKASSFARDVVDARLGQAVQPARSGRRHVGRLANLGEGDPVRGALRRGVHPVVDQPVARPGRLGGGWWRRRGTHAAQQELFDQLGDGLLIAAPWKMDVTLELDEAGARDAGGELRAQAAPDGAISTAMDHERWRPHGGQQILDVEPEHALEERGRHLLGGRLALKPRQVLEQVWMIARNEDRRERVRADPPARYLGGR